MRTKDEIMADPQATHEEIYAIKDDQMFEKCWVLAHANCPPDLWWELAKSCPVEAIKSSCYPLFTLESPERWTALEEMHVERWIRLELQWMTSIEQEEWSIECLERLLPFCVAEDPAPLGEVSLREATEAIEARRKFNRAQVVETPRQITLARMELSKVLSQVRHRKGMQGAESLARQALAGQFALELAANARTFIANAKSRGGATFDEIDRGYDRAKPEETRWQWHRLLDYRRGQS